jgi:phage-related tail fiber protein
LTEWKTFTPLQGGLNPQRQVFPCGVILMTAASTADDGWLLCDGAAVSRTTYANLFRKIGTTYGTGDGSTTFNVPNLQGRVPVGVSSTDGDFDLGDSGGEKTATLSDANCGLIRGGAQAVDPGPDGYAWHEQAHTAFSILQPYLTINFQIKC